jgi:hypothetical protein
MQIEKGNFVFRKPLTPLNLNKVIAIAIHHMAHPTWDEQDVHKYHYETNGWDGIGYNYFVRLDGRIVEGRGLNVGAGVKGHNDKIINLGFQGDYDKQKEMPDTQFQAGVWLINHLKNVLPNDIVVDSHSRWNPTKCPGKNFPLVEMINAKPVEEFLDWKTAIVKEAHDLGIILDYDHWNLNKDNYMPTWAVLATVINSQKKLKEQIEELKINVQNMKG